MTDQSSPQPRIQRASRMRNTTTDEARQRQGTRKDIIQTSQPAPNDTSAKIALKPSDSPDKKKRRSFMLRRFQSISPRTRMVGMFIASIIIAVLVVFLYQQVANFVTITSDDLHYGRPRTFQVDAFVGDETGNTPSHFIAVNLQGHIEIIELPGGDAAHVQVYSGPQLVGPNADLIPPTLQFVDANHNQYKDMILQAGSVQVYFHNVQGIFHSS